MAYPLHHSGSLFSHVTQIKTTAPSDCPARKNTKLYHKPGPSRLAIIFWPLSVRQRNAIQMAFRWRAESGPRLNAYWKTQNVTHNGNKKR